MNAKLAVLGLGPMGHAIAHAFHSAGHPTSVWNRSAERADDLESLGAQVAATPAEALAGAGVAVISVRGNEVAREILTRADLNAASPVIVNLSSDTPSSARELASWAADRGARYLGGSMLTPSILVGQPGSTAVVGGARGIYDLARPVLEVIAPEVAFMGEDAGTVAALDLALLDAFWTTVAGWSHGVALARAEGIEATALADRMTAMVHLAAEVGREISQDAEATIYPGDVSTIASAHATLAHILGASTDRKIDTTIPASVAALLQRIVDDGHRDDGPSRLVPTIEAGDVVVG